MTNVSFWKLLLPSIVLCAWATLRAFGLHGQWFSVCCLTALAIAYAVAEVERAARR